MTFLRSVTDFVFFSLLVILCELIWSILFVLLDVEELSDFVVFGCFRLFFEFLCVSIEANLEEFIRYFDVEIF